MVKWSKIKNETQDWSYKEGVLEHEWIVCVTDNLPLTIQEWFLITIVHMYTLFYVQSRMCCCAFRILNKTYLDEKKEKYYDVMLHSKLGIQEGMGGYESPRPSENTPRKSSSRDTFTDDL